MNFLGVGIFSAENLARDVFNAKSLDNYLIVRFIQSNKIELLFINDGLLSVYAQCRLSDNLIKPSLLLGDSECKHKVLDALRDALFKSKNKNTYLQKIYLYQSQGQSPLIKNIIKSNSDELVLLNAFNYNSSESYSPKLSEIFNHISYAELGNMFRGINV